MAAYEDSYKAQLQGVSQQLPKDRLDGQLTEQLNMLSDPVTNLRRRPGLIYANSFEMNGALATTVAAWSANVGTKACEVVVNAATGGVRVVSYDQSTRTYTNELDFIEPYLIAADVRNLSVVSVNTELFLINREKVMGKGPGPGTMYPQSFGFFAVEAGAFSTKYSVTITNRADTSYTATYTTPSGAGTGDADLTTPAAIAQALATAITNAPAFGSGATVGGVTVFVKGSSVFVYDPGGGGGAFPVRVTTASGKALMTVSGTSYLADAQSLPPALASEANGYVIATTSTTVPVYYQYVSYNQTWLETSEYTTGFLTLTNSPVSIVETAGVLSEVTTPFEGRLAGDEDSAPAPRFVGERITGTGTYQGRLVLMVGNTVYLSASGKPRRFFRSTVTDLLDADTIGVAASAAAGAVWEQSLEYSKDLLLFSTNYQGLIPGSSSAVTPRTASVLVSSKYDGDTTTAPVNIGKTVMFSVPANDSYFGMMEMLESQYADSKYGVYESTVHLPKYLAGRCRVAVASSAARMAVFLSSADPRVAYVHEFQWEGDTKRQQAWHEWRFPVDVASVLFIGGRLHFLFAQHDRVSVMYMDPRAKPTIQDSTYHAPLDFHDRYELIGGRTAIPDWFALGFPELLGLVEGCVATGVMASEPVPVERVSYEFVAPKAAPETSIIVGVPFTSRVEFTPPMLKDYNGVRITTNKQTVTRFILGTNASREFQISVTDKYLSQQTADGLDPYTVGPLYFSSTELELGEARVGGPDSSIIIPARTEAISTRLIASTASTGELNIVSLEYVMKYKEHIQRKKG